MLLSQLFDKLLMIVFLRLVITDDSFYILPVFSGHTWKKSFESIIVKVILNSFNLVFCESQIESMDDIILHLFCLCLNALPNSY